MTEIVDPDDWPPKNKHLRLVADNDPEYHERPSAKGLKEPPEAAESTAAKKKKTKVSKEKVVLTAEDQQKEHDTVQELKDKTSGYSPYVIGGLTLGFLVVFFIRDYLQQYLPKKRSESPDRPAEIVPLYRDFNHDGVPDSYIETKQGHKVPMYGVRIGSGNSIKYINAEEMNKRAPMGREYYDSLESILNNPSENSP